MWRTASHIQRGLQRLKPNDLTAIASSSNSTPPRWDEWGNNGAFAWPAGVSRRPTFLYYVCRRQKLASISAKRRQLPLPFRLLLARRPCGCGVVTFGKEMGLGYDIPGSDNVLNMELARVSRLRWHYFQNRTLPFNKMKRFSLYVLKKEFNFWRCALRSSMMSLYEKFEPILYRAEKKANRSSITAWPSNPSCAGGGHRSASGLCRSPTVFVICARFITA